MFGAGGQGGQGNADYLQRPSPGAWVPPTSNSSGGLPLPSVPKSGESQVPGLGAKSGAAAPSGGSLSWARTPESRRPSEKDAGPRKLPLPPSKALLPMPPSKGQPPSKGHPPSKGQPPSKAPAKNMGFLFMEAEEEARSKSSSAPAAVNEEEWEFLEPEPPNPVEAPVQGVSSKAVPPTQPELSLPGQALPAKAPPSTTPSAGQIAGSLPPQMPLLGLSKAPNPVAMALPPKFPAATFPPPPSGSAPVFPPQPPSFPAQLAATTMPVPSQPAAVQMPQQVPPASPAAQTPEQGTLASAVPPKQGSAPTAAMLTAIREGIGREDRVGVRAAVEAAEKAGIVFEPHIQKMLQQWLPEPKQSAPAPVEPKAPSPKPAAPGEMTALLALIRVGISNEDRVGVKAAVEAAKSAGMVLEPHIQEMLDRWLPGPQQAAPSQPTQPAQPASFAKSGPQQAMPSEPAQLAQPANFAKSASLAGAPAALATPLPSLPAAGGLPQVAVAQTAVPPETSQTLLAKIRAGIASQDRAAVRAAVQVAMQTGISLEANIQSMLKQWLGDAYPTETPAPNPSIVAGVAPVLGMPSSIPGSLVAAPSPPAAGLLLQPTLQVNAGLPVTSVTQPITLPVAASVQAAVSATPMFPALGAVVAPDTGSSSLLSVASAPEVTLAAAAPVVKQVSKPAPPPAAPGQGVSIFKRPVLKKDEVDLDKAMDDFFAEIGGDDEKAAEEPAQPAEAEGTTAPAQAPEHPVEQAPPALAEPARPVEEPAPASTQTGGIANDGSFMAKFLASVQKQDQAPPPAKKDDSNSDSDSSDKEEVVKESAPKKRSLKEIQEARKAARKRDASPPPPPKESAAKPPPPKDEPDTSNTKAKVDGFMLWPGEKIEDEDDSKKPKKAPEAWEYLKKDDFGTGNFFSFDSF